MADFLDNKSPLSALLSLLSALVRSTRSGASVRGRECSDMNPITVASVFAILSWIGTTGSGVGLANKGRLRTDALSSWIGWLAVEKEPEKQIDMHQCYSILYCYIINRCYIGEKDTESRKSLKRT